MESSLSHLSMESLLQILDYSSDEIFVLNEKNEIIFVNNACEKHYGLKKQEVLGRKSDELFSTGYWYPSILPAVLERKQPVTLIQHTVLGAELLTSAIPIFDEAGEISLIVTTARELQSYKQLNQKSDKKTMKPDTAQATMTTNNAVVKKLFQFAHKVARTDSTILIQGESGTGKSLLARYIHDLSDRKDEPFLTINCAAIPADLIEAELFGYVGGAFTGAIKEGKKGLLEAANRGTVFLDEIGEIPLVLQAKLLQVIQEKTFLPIGSSQESKVDIRFITATNQSLLKMVEEKLFREDLYYRLNVIELKLPPLRERKEDIIPLSYKFLYKFNRLYQVNQTFSEPLLEALMIYPWPGNIRQLENTIERLVITSDDVIKKNDLPELLLKQVKAQQETVAITMKEAIEQTKSRMIRESFANHRTTRKVAEDLGISQSQASKLIRQYCVTTES